MIKWLFTPIEALLKVHKYDCCSHLHKSGVWTEFAKLRFLGKASLGWNFFLIPTGRILVNFPKKILI